jgi:hypothetical protein
MAPVNVSDWDQVVFDECATLPGAPQRLKTEVALAVLKTPDFANILSSVVAWAGHFVASSNLRAV